MSWIDPKTDWNAGDGVMAGDLNRIEQNTLDIRNIMRRHFSFGGKAENIIMSTGRAYIVAISQITLRPEWRTLLTIGGVTPMRATDGGFIVLRDTPYTSNNPTWAQLTNGSIFDADGIQGSRLLYSLPDVNDVVSCYAHIGFVNTFESMYLQTYHQLYATIAPYPHA
jgi:hypothetical protein